MMSANEASEDEDEEEDEGTSFLPRDHVTFRGGELQITKSDDSIGYWWVIVQRCSWLWVPGCLDALALGVVGGGSFLILQQDYFATRRSQAAGIDAQVQCQQLQCKYWDGVYISGPLPQCDFCMRAGGDLAIWMGVSSCVRAILMFFTSPILGDLSVHIHTFTITQKLARSHFTHRTDSGGDPSLLPVPFLIPSLALSPPSTSTLRASLQQQYPFRCRCRGTM